MMSEHQPSTSDMKLVIAASSAGTVFEWYDFFIYGTLGSILSKTFFPAGNAALAMLLFWLVFAVGFGFRPLGAILFGFLGDRLGRKYTFLVTVTLMGVATAGVGLIPSAASIGLWAPAIVIFLRVLQGLALGGEYGGAAVYVAEHAPPGKRGYYTGFIQSSVVGGFVLSLIVVLSCKALMGPELWTAWGWRVPFLLSIVLLAISLWMRMKLSESPVFKAMQEEGELSGNPFVESMTYPGNAKRLFVALCCAAGMTVVWYTAMFYAMTFLKGTMRIDDTHADIIAGMGAGLGLISYVFVGKLSDRIGRKLPILLGYGLTLLLIFPLFWAMNAVGNPALTQASERAPIVVTGPDCSYAIFTAEQPSQCGKLLADLSAAGVAYSLQQGDDLTMTAGSVPVDLSAYPWTDKAKRTSALASELKNKGYDLAKVTPDLAHSAILVLLVMTIVILAGLTYGPLAALLTEMFPPRIRYSSMSIPYHFGTGYFGGFLPLIAAAIVAKTGNPYAGLWYTWVVVLVAFFVCLWGLKGGPPSDFSEDG